MSLEDFSPDIESSEWAGNSAESAKESSEKIQEQKAKAWAKAQKSQKDEKKAKKYDFLLAGFLVKIIVDKQYDILLNELISCTHKSYPSNFILGVLSLINLDISDKIREISSKDHIELDFEIPAETQEFDAGNMNPAIQWRINDWIEDILDSVQIEYSQVTTQKLLEWLTKSDEDIHKYIQKVFRFFLGQINMQISDAKLHSITSFIISEVHESIRKIKFEDF